MKRMALVGLLVGAVAAGGAFAQTTPAAQTKKPAEKSADQTKKPADQTKKPADETKKPAAATQKPAAEKPPMEKPAAETAKPAAAARQAMRGNSLGSVRLPHAVMADGTKLNAGSYQIRSTEENATPAATGATPQYERYVEFLRGGKVVARVVASIVPSSEIKQVAETTIPAAGHSRVELLKGGDYWRVWVNRSGEHWLIHLPPA